MMSSSTGQDGMPISSGLISAFEAARLPTQGSFSRSSRCASSELDVCVSMGSGPVLGQCCVLRAWLTEAWLASRAPHRHCHCR